MTEKRSRIRWLLVVFGAFGVSAISFYYLQNAGQMRGGDVAPVKVAWLFTVIAYWYVLPAFWWLDHSLTRQVRFIALVLLMNMVIRAAFEIPMMLADSWHHSYGIGHDLFSAALCLWLSFRVSESSRWLRAYCLSCVALFLVEAVFAAYLRAVTAADGRVFYLPSDQAHLPMMLLTGVAVGFAWVMTISLLRRWYVYQA